MKVAPDELYVKAEVKLVEAPEEQKVAQDEAGAKEEPSGIDENVRVDLGDNEDELRLTQDDYGSGQWMTDVKTDEVLNQIILYN